ncbi:RHS repeat-associated core domain-containing protein [Cohnella faecalis]|nr:RHS repeat-associated core domain-containing protein [Cohnella faecalis]
MADIAVLFESGRRHIANYKFEACTDSVYATNYSYNGDGYRTSVVDAVYGTTKFYWSGDQIELEADKSGQMRARNVYGLERIGHVIGSGSTSYLPNEANTYYYLYDGHGDTRALLDVSGEIASGYRYDPWGRVTSATGTLDNPYLYAGEYTDVTGLQYLRSRYYNPAIGRFLTEDTYPGQLSNPLTMNLYVYVGNNPMVYTDPSGHVWKAWHDGPEWLPFSQKYIDNYENNLKQGLDWIDRKNKALGSTARVQIRSRRRHQ